MKNRKFLKTIILFFIILFFCLICFLFYLIQIASSETEPKIEAAIIRQKEKNREENNVPKNEKEEKVVKIADKTPMHASNEYLSCLVADRMGSRSISTILEEEKELENGYVSYNNGEIEIRKVPSGSIRNIIFTSKYDGKIARNVDSKTSLEEILEYYPENAFGSLEKDYLGYLTDDFYYFYYDDEISIYGYTYKEDEKFEKRLEKYLNDKDLDGFVTYIKAAMKYYDYLEYDPEIKKAHIMFSNRGYEIDIEDNNPKGIILYSNYYLTEKTKEYVEKGIITLKEKEDSVEKIEKERRATRIGVIDGKFSKSQ